MTVYVPTDPARAAALLGPDSIHVWRFPYRHDDGRDPFRALLSAYLDIDVSRVVFIDGPHGRPSLAPPHQSLAVNWSHSGDWAVLAVARDLPVLGIDIECPRPRRRALDLARRFFHPDEYDLLCRLPSDLVESAFLRFWTAKEAVLKALGEGLRFGLHRIRFTLRDDRIIADAFDAKAGPSSSWHLLRHDDIQSMVSLAWRDSPRDVLWMSKPGD